ncbi:hypothetical protein Q8F57_000595 [Paraburkholderia terrae]|uniref:hypothetical protein n=1 Tax=Paraburkholderia terrae TaxID=311230 RepID=UPI00296ABF5A|nr:hypothetical protein [Paraburkholderia terrae]MDW3663472.1 hypothetical protein [Paraburkholderia terrae]
MKPTVASPAPPSVLEIVMPEVFAFTAVHRKFPLHDYTLAMLFPVLHTIRIARTTAGLEQLDTTTGLWRATLERARATLVIKVPAVANWYPTSSTPPYADWPPVEIDVLLSGDAVLSRNAQGPAVQVRVGSLSCAAAPVFRALPNPSPGTKGSLLGSLWPTISTDGAGLDYVFTPQGLCLAGPLASGMRDLLLLPGRAADVAWSGNNPYFALLSPDANKPPSSTALITDYARDIDKWAEGDTPWTVRRWRILNTHGTSLLASAFDRAFDLQPGLRFERTAPSPDSSDPAWQGDLLVHLSAPHDSRTMSIVFNAGLCVSARPVAVHFDWSATGASSVMGAQRAIARWAPGKTAGEITWIDWIVRTPAATKAQTTPAPTPALRARWGRPGAAHTLSLSRVSLFYEGLLDAQDNVVSDRDARPRWLATNEGLLELSAQVFDAHAPQTVREVLSRPSQQFSGGVPLDALGGPPGLSAWIADDPATPAYPAVTLSVRTDRVRLDVLCPTVEWRCPAWWISLDQAVNSDDAPTVSGEPLELDRSRDGIAGLQSRLRAVFDAGFAARPAPGDAATRLSQVLGQVFCGSRWIGGATGGDPAGAWTLELDGEGVSFTLPVSASGHADVKAWSRFDNAYFVRTLPEPGETHTGAVVDPLRALFPARPVAHSPGIELRIVPGRLPAYATPPFRRTGEASLPWQRVPATGFHPHIAGLSLEGPPEAPAQQVLRHGQQMHLEAWLQTTADGSALGKLTRAPLETVRPGDDVASLLPDRQGVRFKVDGWLPPPGQVELELVDSQPGGDRPRIEFKTPGWAQVFTLGASLGADGFGSAAGMVLDKVMPRLVASTAPGAAPMLNFGQPLLQLADGRTLDGAGRRQGLFDGEKRRVEPLSPDGEPEPACITMTRTATLSWAGQPSSPVTLTLLDSDPADLARASWDLCGVVSEGLSSRPAIGPCALVARALQSFDASAVRVTCKLAPPWSTPSGAALDDSPALVLQWEFRAGTWGLADVVSTDIDWRFDDTGAGTRVVAMRVRVGGQPQALKASVTRVELETDALGRIVVVPSAPAPLVWSDAGSGPQVRCQIAQASGVALDMTLVGQPAEGGCAWDVSFPTPLSWGEPAGVRLTLADAGATLVLKGLRLNDAVDDIVLHTSRASGNAWLLSAAAAGLAFAGTLQATTPANVSTQFDIQACVKYSVDPRLLVADCDTGLSWLVAVGNLAWNSTLAVAAALAHATVGGRIVFRNTFAFRRATGIPWRDEVDVVFDSLPGIIGPGGVWRWPGTLDLMAVHRVGPAGGPSQVAFAAVHRFQVANATLASASLICLCEGDAAPIALEPQIVFGADRALGVAAIAPPSGSARGLVLRLPVRSGSDTVELRVPDARQGTLDWFPLRRWESGLTAAPDDLWHERRVLAPCLSPATLATLGSAQTVAHFAGGAPWPAANEVLAEWGAIADVRPFPRSGFLAPGQGVFALPWYAGAIQAKAVRLATEAASLALQVQLYAAAAGATTGLRVFASGLVCGFEDMQGAQAAVGQWALDETTRRRHRGATLAIARGRNELGLLLTRSLHAHEAPRTSTAPVGTALTTPAHSNALDLLYAGEANGLDATARGQAPLAVAFDEGAVLEVTHALPRAAGVESASEFRLVVHAALARDGWGEGVYFGLERRQAVRFASLPDMQDVLPRARPSLVPADTREVIAAPLVDVAAWSARPGDSVWTQWSAAAGASSAGPGMRIRLREPRATHTAPVNGGAPEGETFTLTALTSTSVGGAEWRLHELTRSRVIGQPFSQPFLSLLSVATPRGVLHAPDIHAARGDALPLAISRVAREADGWIMSDPMVLGAFVSPGAHLDANEQWGLAVVSGQFDATAPLEDMPDADKVLSDKGLGWMTPNAPGAVSIHTFATVAQLTVPVTTVNAYTDTAAATLARLVAQTPRRVGAPSSAHWLHGSPRLALWRRAQGATAVALIPHIEIVWIDASMMESAPRVCTVNGNFQARCRLND